MILTTISLSFLSQFHMNINYYKMLRILAVLFVLNIHVTWTWQEPGCSSNYAVCVKSEHDNDYTTETTKCSTFDQTISLDIKCQIMDDYAYQSRFYDVISVEIQFTEINESSNLSDVFDHEMIGLKWYKQSKHSSEREFLALNQTSVSLNRVDNQTLLARLIFSGFKLDTLYKFCINNVSSELIQSIDPDNDFCCRIEEKEHEEELNESMVIVVLIILFIIYSVVILVNWLCPSSKFNTIEEVLSSLPSDHVDKLQKLIQEQGVKTDEEDEEKSPPASSHDPDVKTSFAKYTQRKRMLKKARKPSLANLDEDKEATIEPVQPRPHSSIVVKFEEENEEKNKELEDAGILMLKLAKESHRRASIKPYKRMYALNVSSSSSSSSDDEQKYNI